jgi:hypothetical protein
VLGNAPWYTALWFEQLTGGLPAHRTLWELAPWILTLTGIALVAWAAALIAGRWAGAITGLTCGCAGATLLTTQFGWAIHAVAYVHICVLGAFIVPLALRSGRIGGWPSHVALAALVAVVTGLGRDSLPARATAISSPSDNLAIRAPFTLRARLRDDRRPTRRRSTDDLSTRT